jgi:hypothetical protein
MTELNDQKAQFLQSIGVEPKVTPPASETIEPTEPVVPVEPTEPIVPTTPTEPITPAPTQPVGLTEDIKLQAINEVLGTNYSKLEDAVEAKNRMMGYDELKEYKEKYDELSSKPLASFHSKTIEELNNFAKVTGIDDPTIIRSVKAFSEKQEKDPIEALVLAEILNDPTLAEKRDLLKKQISRKYKTEVDEDLYGEDLEKAREEADLSKFQLERDASKAIKSISETLEKVNTESKDNPYSKTQEQKQNLKAQWDNVIVSNYDKIFGKVPVQVPKGKDESGNTIYETIDTIELSPTEAKQYAEQAVKSLVNSGTEITEANLVDAVYQQHLMIQAKHIEKVKDKMYAKIQAEVRLNLEKEIHNPSSLKGGNTPPPQAPVKEFGDKILEKLESMNRLS